jgi:prepilin-type N-terminal cleavage/methylation domain-containing protein/prepilin-type processing-associated H-X9-DG protein
MIVNASRRGFSLIELLVVMGILSILLGLLLSAIQKARASVQKTQCADRLRQIGLALHNYHDNQKALPPGMSLNADAGAYPYLSWNARVLPYLEQEAMWRETAAAFRNDRNFAHDPPQSNLNRMLPAFICPADPRAQNIAYCVSRNLWVAFTSYLGVEGTNLKKLDGVFFIDSQIRLVEITDGTSNTIMVGERPPSADNRFGWWYAGIGQLNTGSGDMVLGVREFLATDEPCPTHTINHFQPGSDNNICDFLHFWSYHPGGANFCFADGSVRFLSYSVDPIMPALATRGGGEVVELP